jgi:hypothetical protein
MLTPEEVIENKKTHGRSLKQSTGYSLKWHIDFISGFNIVTIIKVFVSYLNNHFHLVYKFIYLIGGYK